MLEDGDVCPDDEEKLSVMDTASEASEIQPNPEGQDSRPLPQVIADELNEEEQWCKKVVMATGWQELRVYISSTFKDMHWERDCLNKVVFPRLNDWGAHRRIRWVPVDLRWGLFTEDTSEEGKGALLLSLDEVRNSRPWFLCLLGSRYGWIPDTYLPRHYAADPHYAWLNDLAPGLSAVEVEMLYGFLASDDQRIQSCAFIRSDDSAPELEYSEPPSCAHKLADLKQRVRAHSVCKVIDYAARSEEFAQHAFQVLQAAALRNVVGCSVPAELGEQRFFYEMSMSRTFQLKAWSLVDSTSYLLSAGDKGVFVVWGASGFGKTSLLCNLVHKLTDDAHPCIYHFVGDNKTSYLCSEVSRLLHKPPTLGDAKMLQHLLEEYSNTAHMCLVMVVDAMSVDDLEWLKIAMRRASKVRCVVAANLDADTVAKVKKEFEMLDIRLHHARLDEMTEYQRQWFIHESLRSIRKGFDTNQYHMISSKEHAGIPLYLTLFIEELRFFGLAQELNRKIQELPGTLEALLKAILRRLEGDHTRELVQRTLSLIACSRRGVTEDQLLVLAARPGDSDGVLPRRVWQQLFNSMKLLLRRSGNDGSRLEFFHKQVRRGVLEEYLTACPVLCDKFVAGDYCGHLLPSQLMSNTTNPDQAVHRRIAHLLAKTLAAAATTPRWYCAESPDADDLRYHLTLGAAWDLLESWTDTLDLSGMKLDPDALVAIGRSLPAMSRIRTLRLCYLQSPSPWILNSRSEFFEALCRNTCITLLDVSHTNLGVSNSVVLEMACVLEDGSFRDCVLDVRDCSIPYDVMCDLLHSLKIIRSLPSSLSLPPPAAAPTYGLLIGSNCFDLRQERVNLLDLLAPLDYLQHLDLSQCAIFEEHHQEELTKLLEAGLQLQSLSLWGNVLGDSAFARASTAIAAFIARTPTLKSICLDACEITSTGAFLILQALAASTSLTSLSIAANSIQKIETCGTVRRVMFDTAACEAMQALHLACPLVELDVSHNDFCDHGSQALSNVLRSATALQMLDVSSCKVTDTDMSNLSGASSSLASLTSLRLNDNLITSNGCVPLRHLLTSTSRLEHLVLSRNKIDVQGCVCLHSCFEGLGHLRTLILDHNPLKNRGIKTICAALLAQHPCPLEHLSLNMCQCDDPGADAVADLVRTSTCIATLNLSCNDIADPGAKSLATAITCNPSLKTLDISWNQIGNSGLMALLHALDTNSTLQRLSMHMNSTDMYRTDALAFPWLPHRVSLAEFRC